MLRFYHEQLAVAHRLSIVVQFNVYGIMPIVCVNIFCRCVDAFCCYL